MFRITSIPVYLQLTSSHKISVETLLQGNLSKIVSHFLPNRGNNTNVLPKGDRMGPKQAISKNQNANKNLQSQYPIMYKYTL